MASAVVIPIAIWLIVGDDTGRMRARARVSSSSVVVRGTGPAPNSRSRTFLIGRSVQGRPIIATSLGTQSAARTVLVVACIHGDEPAGIAIARRLVHQSAPPGTALWVVPVLNPDGVIARTRQNADGVDLNRNFPWHWRPRGSRGDLQYSGQRPLSEPESQAARRLILRVRPQITIWFHQPLGVVDLSGGNPGIERRFARLTHRPVRRLTRYPGSAVSWEIRCCRGRPPS
jgi:murein peptide amidase A